jgi:phosphoribosylamine---glycine ligase
LQSDSVDWPKTNVLIVGSGGREHALAWKILQSRIAGDVYVAPGNAGTQEHNVAIKPDDLINLRRFAEEHKCLTIVGPETPLAAGIVDYFSEKDLRIFGPTKEQARLETSKTFAKQFMSKNGIPTAEYEVFDDAQSAIDYVHGFSGNVVVKADGLAAGKGVFVCSSSEEAEDAIKSILEKRIFGEAGRQIVIERRLEGREISLMAICDGKNALPFGTAVDHKRAFDGDIGPNTGGMGAYSPAIGFDDDKVHQIMREIVLPTVRASGFRGFLYTGLMLTENDSKRYVLEYNARLGDPETQAILPRMNSDLLECLEWIEAFNDVIELKIGWDTRDSCTVVMCSEGYPQKPRIGERITGVERAQDLDDVIVFHAGTVKSGDYLLTNGGRVLCVTGMGETHAIAAERAYEGVSRISWRGEFHRSDVCSPFKN